MELADDLFDIRYIRLRFVAEMLSDGTVPREKVSAIRGGIGDMLLKDHCVSDGDCERCRFVNECLVQKIMYSKFEIKPEFVTLGESIGYVIECDDHAENVKKGDRLQFVILLFGKNTAYVREYIDAAVALGSKGIGKNGIRFSVEYVNDGKEVCLYSGGRFNGEKVTTCLISDYVDKRMSEFDGDDRLTLRFVSPLTVKFQRRFITRLDTEAILESMARRIYMFNCFSGNECDYPCVMPDDLPEELQEESFRESVQRYSARKKQKIILYGLKGKLELAGVKEEMLRLMLACELTHIGKNTSFGFGKFYVE